MHLRVDTNAESDILGCRYEVICLGSGSDTPNKPRDKNELFSGWAPKGAGGISKLVPFTNEFLVRRTYVKRD